MCLVLSRFMEVSKNNLDQESLSFLKTKLCRRLAKIESGNPNATTDLQKAYEYLSAKLSTYFERSVEQITNKIKISWEQFKSSTHRAPGEMTLPFRADFRHLQLRLPNSQLYLRQILAQPLSRYRNTHNLANFQLPKEYIAYNDPAKPGIFFNYRYSTLADLEEPDLMGTYVTAVSIGHYPICFLTSIGNDEFNIRRN